MNAKAFSLTVIVTMASFSVFARADDNPKSAVNGGEHSWHLLIKSRNGTVSLLKDLTKHQCEFSKNRMLGRPATEEEKTAFLADVDAIRERSQTAQKECEARPNENFGASNGLPCLHGSVGAIPIGLGKTVGPGDIETAECFQ